MRQLVFEYLATDVDSDLRRAYGPNPVLTILVRAYSYLIARYDLDGLRIDTAKYVSPTHLEWFGNAIREFGHSIGSGTYLRSVRFMTTKRPLLTLSGATAMRQAALGSTQPLTSRCFPAPSIAKGLSPVDGLRRLFANRISKERELLTSHGEAGRFFVSFLDNHDQHERFHHPNSHPNQITLGIALLFTLQGIPSLYYGTESGLTA